MKKITTIVLFVGIFAVAAGIIGLSGNSATPLIIAAAPQSQEQFGILGHVEYKVMDSSGNVIQYMQGDNIITNDGKSCVGQKMFGTNGKGSCFTDSITKNEFNYIGIGNGSSVAVSATDKTLSDTDGNDKQGTCATTGIGGEMARLQVTAINTNPTESTGAIVTLDTYANPFTFDISNATVIFDTGLFNANYYLANANYSESRCPVDSFQTAEDDWSMFARQLVNGENGIAVNDGDSLTVKWTITIT